METITNENEWILIKDHKPEPGKNKHYYFKKEDGSILYSLYETYDNIYYHEQMYRLNMFTHWTSP